MKPKKGPGPPGSKALAVPAQNGDPRQSRAPGGMEQVERGSIAGLKGGERPAICRSVVGGDEANGAPSMTATPLMYGSGLTLCTAQ